MNEDTYRDKLNDLQLEVEELRAKLKEAQTGDLISRQAALTALTSTAGVGNRALDKIRALPSAQTVLTCDGCRHVGTYDTDFPCNGCVRREKDYYDPEQ